MRSRLGVMLHTVAGAGSSVQGGMSDAGAANSWTCFCNVCCITKEVGLLLRFYAWILAAVHVITHSV